jgi:ABC-type multidrug transport system fused ATPase/permease subunit
MYVIRAFDRSENFVSKFFQRQKEYIVAYTNQNVSNRWISLVTDLFSIATIATCAYLCVYQRPDPSDPNPHTTNLFGLAITWSLQISAVLSFTLKIMADTESNMNAVLRLLDYIDHNPSEKEFEEPKPPVEWPTDGKFKLDSITYRYRPDLDDVIHGISFDVEQKSKIGIVGRTGSGKSTLTLGLLRILELSENADGSLGTISLDNVNIGNIGLHCNDVGYYRPTT